MAKKKNIKEVILQIIGIGHKGTAIGKTSEGLVVFVRNAVPGDTVLAALYKKRKGVWQGKVLSLVNPSELRQNAFCKHFGDCGGCSWQDLIYAEQLKQKETQVFDAVKRIAGIEPEFFLPILASQQDTWYRNKLEFTFSTHRWRSLEEMKSENFNQSSKALGFHRPESFSKVVDIQKCYLQNDESNSIRNEIKTLTSADEWTYYDIKSHSGLLRNMIIRSNQNNEIMIALSVADQEDPKIPELLNQLIIKFPKIVSVYLAENKNLNDSWYSLNCNLFYGIPYIEEKLDHVKFRIGPKSFFQTNTKQTIYLYNLIKDFAHLQGTEIVYDLFCGVGSIGIFLAEKARILVGIEEVEAAVEDAKINAYINQITNAHFIAGDCTTLMKDTLISKFGMPDLLIVDPPRTGLHPNLIKNIIEFKPKRIIYVSCNPATLARDLAIFNECYQLKKLQAVDMFPHTSHVEAVSLIEYREN